MNWKQKLIYKLTPKRTEEIKSGLFIKTNGDDLITRMEKMSKDHKREIRWEKYRIIYPAVWNNKINWKIFILGVNPFRSLIIFSFILFLAWAYSHDVSFIERLGTEIYKNSTFHLEYCKNITINGPQLFKGTCFDNFKNLNLTNLTLR